MNKDYLIAFICVVSAILIISLIKMNMVRNDTIDDLNGQLQNKSLEITNLNAELLETKQTVLVKEDRVICLLNENIDCRELVIATSQIVSDNFYLLYLNGNTYRLTKLTESISEYTDKYTN
jgi:hypothetical protein